MKPIYYLGNDIKTPPHLTPEEERLWHHRMVAGASVYISPKTWEALRASCLQMLLAERKQEEVQQDIGHIEKGDYRCV